MNLMTPKLLTELKKLIANNEVHKFYWWKQWKFLRARVRKRDRNECQRCKRNGDQSRAEVVHHIKEVKDYPELALDMNNCEALCKACHNIIHPEKLGKYKKQKKRFVNEERW